MYIKLLVLLHMKYLSLSYMLRLKCDGPRFVFPTIIVAKSFSINRRLEITFMLSHVILCILTFHSNADNSAVLLEGTRMFELLPTLHPYSGICSHAYTFHAA